MAWPSCDPAPLWLACSHSESLVGVIRVFAQARPVELDERRPPPSEKELSTLTAKCALLGFELRQDGEGFTVAGPFLRRLASVADVLAFVESMQRRES